MASAEFGSWLGGGGDVDGDGRAEILVRTLDEAWVIPGATAAQPLSAADHFAADGYGGAEWGGVITDLDADGYGDVVLGGATDDLLAAGGGGVSIYPGGPAGLGPVTPAAGTSWGGTRAQPFALGDWDGDGVDDLGVGSGLDGEPVGSGEVRLFAGSPSGPAEPLARFEGHTQRAEIALDLLSADFDGDGLRDLAIGSDSIDGVTSGEVRIWYGAPTPPVLALDDSYGALEDTPLVGAPSVLDDDVGSAASLVMPPLHGDLVLRADGTFDYTPEPDFWGVDGFRYPAHGHAARRHPARRHGGGRGRVVARRRPRGRRRRRPGPERGRGVTSAAIRLTGDTRDVIDAVELAEFAGTVVGPASVTVTADDSTDAAVAVFPFDVVP